MDTCDMCKWSDPIVSIKFVSLLKATWAPEDMRRLALLAHAAMLPKAPRP